MTDTNIRSGITEFNCPVLVVGAGFFMVNQLTTPCSVVFKMIMGNNGMGKDQQPCKKQDCSFCFNSLPQFSRLLFKVKFRSKVTK